MSATPDIPSYRKLYAIIIRLKASQNGSLQATHGHMAYAVFLDILSQVDPTLSQTVHDLAGRKPFTVSPLRGFGNARQGALPIQAGQEGWMRVTLLDTVLFHTFIDYFLRLAGQATIHIDGLTFHVNEILTNPNSHPLAGTDSLAALYQRWNEVDTQSPDLQTIRLRFHTPTTFSRRDQSYHQNYVLPDPFFVFGGLAGAWDRLTGSESKAAMQQFALDHVAIARYDIRTHIYHFRRSRQVGFTGYVVYEVLGKGGFAPDPTLLQHFHRLADLAFYTGVGGKTTMGMGQVTKITNSLFRSGPR